METVILLLGWAISLIFLIHRTLFVIDGKRPSLNLEPIGILLITSYFWHFDFRIMAAAETGLLILVVYNFLEHTPSFQKVEPVILGITICTSLLFTVFSYSGIPSIIEFMASVFVLLGTYALTHKRKPLGWTLLCLSHFGITYLFYTKAPSQTFFAHFQIATTVICLIGLLKRR